MTVGTIIIGRIVIGKIVAHPRVVPRASRSSRLQPSGPPR